MLKLIAQLCRAKGWSFLPYTEEEFQTATVVNLNLPWATSKMALHRSRPRDDELAGEARHGARWKYLQSRP